MGRQLSEEARQQLLEHIERLLAAQDMAQLREVLSASRSSDVAEVVEVQDEVARQILFDLLGPREAGEVLEKIDEATRGEMVEELPAASLREIVSMLPPDEAADVLADVEEDKVESVLRELPLRQAVQIKKLLRYAEDSAGGIMTPVFVSVGEDETVGDAIRKYRESDVEDEFYHVFVVDGRGRFVGSVNLPALLRWPDDTPITEVTEKDLPVVEVGTDQEEVANLFRKNDLIVVGVQDERGLLVGRITVDDVLDVMTEEAEEDALLIAGTHPAELETRQVIKAASVRLPWLITCMIGSMLSAVVLYTWFKGWFEEGLGRLELWTYVVMFAPAIAAMGGNSGLQTSTVVVRGLATGDLAALRVLQVYWRELKVASLVAVSCALVAGTMTTVVMAVLNLEMVDQPALVLGASVGLAMLGAILLSTSLGLVLPFMFRRLGIDPAISSGPLVTTANDALGILTYFTVAFLLVRHFAN